MVTAKPARVMQPAIAPEKDDAAAAFIAGSAATPRPPFEPGIAAGRVPQPVPPSALEATPILKNDAEDHRLTLRMPQEMKDELDRLRATRYRGMTLTGVILLALNGFIDQNKSN